MSISFTLDKLYSGAKQNKWLGYFAVFLRIVLAVGFITAGLTKIMGERFASGLSANHPMGQYLVALYHTGYYYTFIGVAQIVAAMLLLIPRTVTLGALLYLPIILNICILSFALRFEGSILTSPLMVLGDLYLLCWNYDKLKYLLPFDHGVSANVNPNKKNTSNKFPLKFFSAVLAIIILLVLFINTGYDIMPRNSLKDCNSQFQGTNRTQAGSNFCDCIHNQGQPLDSCLKKYYIAPDDAVPAK